MHAMEAQYALNLSHSFSVTAEKLFTALIEPTQLQNWMRPDANHEIVHAENDLRTGGDYRIDLRMPDGRIEQISGLYHQIQPPAFLAFTWRRGDETDAEDTYVELRLHEENGATTLTLLHDEFLTEADRDQQTAYWQGALAALDNHISSS